MRLTARGEWIFGTVAFLLIVVVFPWAATVLGNWLVGA